MPGGDIFVFTSTNIKAERLSLMNHGSFHYNTPAQPALHSLPLELADAKRVLS